MTHKIGNKLFITDTAAAKCELCGNVDELRPYGPRGENICFDCGMKNKPATERAFGAILDSLDKQPH